MGYTNYWNPRSLTNKQIPDGFWDDCIKVLDAIIKSGCKLATWDGSRQLKTGWDIVNHTKLTDTEPPSIVFNGYSDPNGDDESYETFALKFDGEWAFCKTELYPYDIAVKCVLMLAQKYNLLKQKGEMDDPTEESWEFDGDKQDAEYTHAYDLLLSLQLL